MLTIGDHKTHDKKFKYEFYPKEKQTLTKNKTTKRNLKRINADFKQIDYNVWLRSMNKDRINYLKQIGISDKRQLQTLTKMYFHHLPYEVRSRLQTKINPENTKQNPGKNLVQNDTITKAK